MAILDENQLTLLQAGARVRSYKTDASGKPRPTSLSCIQGWVKEGICVPGGRLRLEAVRIGGRWITSVEALERFFAEATARHRDAFPAGREAHLAS